MAAEALGRERELASMQAFLARVREDAPRALVLEGEAGIGKTTLWQAGLTAARSEGCATLETRPSEAEAALPFAGLIDLLAGVLEQALPRLPPPQARALERALLRADPTGEPTDRLAVSLAVLGALTGLAQEQPVVVAVDDLQWLDRPSARVLSFALRRMQEAPVALLLSRRLEGDAEIAVDLTQILPPDRVERLRVGPLSLGVLDLLLRDQLGLALPRPRLKLLLDRTGGNPFFALELGAGLASEAAFPANAGMPVPNEIARLIGKRIAGLSPCARMLLLEVSALSRPSVTAFELRPELEEALASTLLERDGERIRFTHPLYGSAVYSGATASTRRATHRRLADRLDDLEERALHLALAAEGPDEAVATALEDASTRAGTRGAPDAAAQLAEHASRLTPPLLSEQSVRRKTAASGYHAAAGDGPRARAILEQLADELPPGPARADVLWRLASLVPGFGEMERLCEQALAEAQENHVLRARIHLVLGFARCHTGHGFPGWEPHAEEAAEAAKVAGASSLYGTALALVAFIRFFRGQGVQEQLLRRSLELEPEDLTPDDSTIAVLAMPLLFADRLDEARGILEEALRREIERGRVGPQGALQSSLAELELRAGDLERASEYADVALELARQADIANAEPGMLSTSALVDTYRGAAGSARAKAEDGRARARAIGDLIFATRNELALGLLAFSLGDPAAAHEHLVRVVDTTRALGIVDPGPFPAAGAAAEALVAVGELDRAEALVLDLEERAAALDRPRALAQAARARALLEAARGDIGAALAAIRRSYLEHERLGDPFEHARTKLAEGTILRRAKRRAAARTALAVAEAEFTRLGIPLWAERARDESARLGLRSAAGQLTETEAKVAVLAAGGSTNREIAARLFLSVKTVEANLSRVYRKLGVRSRTELAHRLPPDS